MNPVLEEILRTRKIILANGEIQELNSEIAPKEGRLIQKLIAEYQPKKSLEVGLAFGISSLYICEALERQPGASHIIIDPCQTDYWKGIGLNNLKRAGYSHMIKFYESPSSVVLPKLCSEDVVIDFAFIDGSHRFEDALMDFYYISRLLKTDGIVVFDDADWPSIRKICRFILRNLPYRVVATTDPQDAYHSWKWKFLKVFKNSFPILAKGLLKPEIFEPDTEFGRYSSCIAFQKESDKNDSETFHDF